MWEMDQALQTNRIFTQMVGDYKLSDSVVGFWMAVREIEVAGEKPFKSTQRLALVLVIPHPNAAAERMLSCVNKDLTPGRSSLSKDGTLNNILIVKSVDLRWTFNPYDYVMKTAKKTTRIMLFGACA